MAFRSNFPLLSIASSSHPQPALGSWVTAVSPATGFAQPSNVPLTLTLGSASASTNPTNSQYDANMFVAGEQAVLWDPNGSHFETVVIASIAVTSNQVTLGPMTGGGSATGQYNPFTTQPHVAGAIGTGTYILPRMDANNVIVVYEDGGTGPFLYIGKGPLFTTTFQRIYKLAVAASGVQPYYWNAGEFSPGNPIAPWELFVSGTAGDKYSTSFMGA